MDKKSNRFNKTFKPKMFNNLNESHEMPDKLPLISRTPSTQIHTYQRNVIVGRVHTHTHNVECKRIGHILLPACTRL